VRTPGEKELSKAELYLVMRMERARRAAIFGERPKRLFREAVERYLKENRFKRSIQTDELHLKQLDSFIGDLDLRMVHMGTLQEFIEARRAQGRKTKTINLALGVVRHILNLAASEWLDEYGLTWLERPPKVTMLKVTDARKPYPMSWDEQTRLFRRLPYHLARMALFKVNTGCREQEVCSLQWEWEVEVPGLDTSVFIIPDAQVKNGEERLVVLNRTAMSIVNDVRGRHYKYVFTYKDKRILKMNNTA
jgi:integrase